MNTFVRNIDDNDYLNITPLKIHKKLEILSISAKIKEISLDFLNSFPNLKELHLIWCSVGNIPKEVYEVGMSNSCLPQIRAYLEAQEKDLPF